ncbi:hypothetical protein ACROYT_G011179 [Oculina patagonica]
MRSGLATAFILSTLLLAAVYLPLCEGFNGNQTWKKRNLLSQAKRALDNMCRVAREHCKREILNDDFTHPGPRPVQ